LAVTPYVASIRMNGREEKKTREEIEGKAHDEIGQ
jgi:hypothetical protein